MSSKPLVSDFQQWLKEAASSTEALDIHQRLHLQSDRTVQNSTGGYATFSSSAQPLWLHRVVSAPRGNGKESIIFVVNAEHPTSLVLGLTIERYVRALHQRMSADVIITYARDASLLSAAAAAAVTPPSAGVFISHSLPRSTTAPLQQWPQPEDRYEAYVGGARRPRAAYIVNIGDKKNKKKRIGYTLCVEGSSTWGTQPNQDATTPSMTDLNAYGFAHYGCFQHGAVTSMSTHRHKNGNDSSSIGNVGEGEKNTDSPLPLFDALIMGLTHPNEGTLSFMSTLLSQIQLFVQPLTDAVSKFIQLRKKVRGEQQMAASSDVESSLGMVTATTSVIDWEATWYAVFDFFYAFLLKHTSLIPHEIQFRRVLQNEYTGYFRFLRHHCRSSLWYPLADASVASVLSKQLQQSPSTLSAASTASVVEPQAVFNFVDAPSYLFERSEQGREYRNNNYDHNIPDYDYVKDRMKEKRRSKPTESFTPPSMIETSRATLEEWLPIPNDDQALKFFVKAWKTMNNMNERLHHSFRLWPMLGHSLVTAEPYVGRRLPKFVDKDKAQWICILGALSVAGAAFVSVRRYESESRDMPSSAYPNTAVLMIQSARVGAATGFMGVLALGWYLIDRLKGDLSQILFFIDNATLVEANVPRYLTWDAVFFSGLVIGGAISLACLLTRRSTSNFHRALMVFRNAFCLCGQFSVPISLWVLWAIHPMLSYWACAASCFLLLKLPSINTDIIRAKRVFIRIYNISSVILRLCSAMCGCFLWMWLLDSRGDERLWQPSFHSYHQHQSSPFVNASCLHYIVGLLIFSQGYLLGASF